MRGQAKLASVHWAELTGQRFNALGAIGAAVRALLAGLIRRPDIYVSGCGERRAPARSPRTIMTEDAAETD